MKKTLENSNQSLVIKPENLESIVIAHGDDNY